MAESTKTTHPIAPGLKWVAMGLCLFPPLVLAILIWRDAVDVPYWDEWHNGIAGILVKFKAGQLSLTDLWAQHNESRLVVLRLLLIFLGGFTHWNLRYENGVAFLLAITVCILVFQLMQKTLSERAGIRRPIYFIASLLFFSPALSEAWLWGMELILFVPMVCLLGCLLSLRSKMSRTAKLMLCMVLATLSTYSFSNGLLVWLVLLPAWFWPEMTGGGGSRYRAGLVWSVGFAANVLLYFYHYQFPPSSGFWRLLTTHPGQVLEYFLCFLGGPLTLRSSATAVAISSAIGSVVLTLFLWACGQWIKWRSNLALAGRMAPWLAVGGYGLLSAALATMGRAAIGVDQSLSPRYGIFSVSLMVAVACLLTIIVCRPVTEGENQSPRGSCTLAGLGGLLVALHLLAFPANVRSMTVFHLDLLQARTCLQFLDVLPPQPAVTTSLFPDYPWVKGMADQLEQHAIRQDALIQSSSLVDFKINPQTNCGSVEQYQWHESQLSISGWALASNHAMAADSVVFTYEGPGLAPVVFALMDGRMGRRDLAAQVGNPALLMSGWRKTIYRQDLPPGAQMIKAWAYDTSSRALTPLAGDIPIGGH